MTEPSERADTTITLDFADAAKARDAFDRIEVWLHEVGVANDCTLAMSTAPAEPSDAEVETASFPRSFQLIREMSGALPKQCEDLLRDAARYRWLCSRSIYALECLDWDSLSAEEHAVLIDAEIAREAGEAKP